MARPKLTPEERAERKRQYNRQRYQRIKAQKLTDREWDRFLAINPDLFPIKPKLNQEQREFIHSLMNMPLSIEPKRAPRSVEVSEAKKQLGIARQQLNKTPIQTLDFNLSILRPEGRTYLLEHLPEVINELLDKVVGLDDHWTVYYAYDGSWKQRTLDSITQQYLRNQIKQELIDMSASIISNEEINSGDSFFPVSIKTLQEIRFINEDVVGLRGRAAKGAFTLKDFRSADRFRVYEQLLKTKAPKRVLESFLNSSLIRSKRTGKFWRWLNLFPEVDLERFMIFHRLDNRTAVLAERDNCFIYACRMAGLSNDLINDMRFGIKKRSFGTIDIKEVSKRLGISFSIKTSSGRVWIGDKANEPIKLLLMNDHYMIDQKVPISPYYILHRREILNDPVASRWSNSERLAIVGRRANGMFERKTRLHSIKKVLEAMFAAGGFQPISSSDFMVFNSLICYEDVDPIGSLEYKVELCARRKERTG